MLWGCCLTLSGLSTVDVGVLSKGSFVLDEAEAVFTGVEGKFASDEAFQRSIHDAAAGFASDPLTTMDTPLHALIRISADHDVSTASVRAWEARVMKATDATSAAKAFAFGEYLGAHPAKNPARNPHVHHFMTPATPAQLVALAALPQIESFVLVPAELKVAPDLWAEIATPKSAASDYVHLLVGLTDGHLASQDEAGAVARAVQASIDALPSVAAATLTSVAASLPLPIASHHAADRLSVANISRALLADVVRSVALHAEVTWVEEQPHYEYSNRFAHALQQSGGTAATVAGGASGVAGDSPLWDAGLHGEGEVVGVGDSGLDHMSCYFYDAANPLTITPNEINNFPAHSKVVQYVPFASTGEDEDGGHGTHVCGSVAGRGSGQCDLIEDDGMAYAAKLAFFDIGQPGAQGLNVPQSLRTQMFPPSYDVGARIHTNSWGANTNRYSLNSRDVDAYSFEKQDYLVLVAAGNSGSEGLGSVGSPATAKSCMSIGASSSPTASFALVGANTNDPNVADQVRFSSTVAAAVCSSCTSHVWSGSANHSYQSHVRSFHALALFCSTKSLRTSRRSDPARMGGEVSRYFPRDSTRFPRTATQTRRQDTPASLSRPAHRWQHLLRRVTPLSFGSTSGWATTLSAQLTRLAASSRAVR